VSRVSNYTRGHMQAVINIPIAYEADIGQALALLEEAARDIAAMPEVVDGPKVIGVVDMKPGEVVVRVIAKTVPLEQVKVETAYRRKAIALFEAARIPMPAAPPVWPGRGEGKA
jgi:small-conductance mechanosensitive channel